MISKINFGHTSAPPFQALNLGAFLSMMIAKPCLLWRRRLKTVNPCFLVIGISREIEDKTISLMERFTFEGQVILVWLAQVKFSDSLNEDKVPASPPLILQSTSLGLSIVSLIYQT